MKKMIAILCVVVLAASAVIGVTNVRSSNKIKGLNEDLASMQDLIKENQKNMDALTEEVAEKAEALTVKEAEIETLTADVADKAEQIEQLTADVADKEAKIESLTADVADKTAQITALNATVETHAAEIAALTEQASAAQAQIDTLAAESAEKNAQIETLSADLTSAQQKLQLIIDTITGTDAEEASEPEEALPALPQTDDVIRGFQVMETREDPLLNATLIRFEHQQTGAELIYIANDDINRAFALSFLTDAVDDTGLPHALEHMLINGSEKYPSSSLFFNLQFQTYNTGMNAYTTSRFTYYPVSSLSEAQLLKLADFYTDSCFHPAFLADENTFRTQIWRYRLENADADLALEGTLYSEVLGRQTLEDTARTNALRLLFPGAQAGNVFAGDPDRIPDLTCDLLTAYHAQYYHPSNCVAFLYGQLTDYAAFLELLDGYFSAYERKEVTRAEDAYTPIEAPIVQSFAYPVEQDFDPEDATAVCYGIVCPGLKQDPNQELALITLSQLLGSEASDFQQALKAALPSGTFSVALEQDGPEDALMIYAYNINPENAELFRQTVDAQLAAIAENGIPQDQLDGIMAQLSISTLLIREMNDPLQTVIQPMLTYYTGLGRIWGLQEYQATLMQMDDLNREGVYAQAVGQWLIDSASTVLATTAPVPGAREQKDAEQAQALAEIKAGMTEEEIAAIVELSNAPADADDASAYVAQLQAVTVESLPDEVKQYAVSDQIDDMGVRHIDATAAVSGVGHVSLYLDAAGLAQEDIHWFNLYTSLIGNLDTAAHTKAELLPLLSRYLLGGSIELSVIEPEAGGYHPYLCMSWLAQDDDLATGYDLMRELLFDTKTDDPALLLEQVQALKSALKSGVNANPLSVQLYRAIAVHDEAYRYLTYATQLEYCDFLTEAEQLLKEDPDAAVAKLESIRQYFNNSANAVVLFAGSEESAALNRTAADAFLAGLEQREIEAAVYDLPVPAAKEGLIIESGVQNNLLLADYDALGVESFDAGLHVITTLVQDAYLFPLLRDQYGVYTPNHGVFEREGMYICTYRDPNIDETYAVLEQLPEQIAALDLDQETLDGYILRTYSNIAMPEGELSGALTAALNTLQGIPQDRKQAWLHQIKQVTPEAVKETAPLYAALAESGVRSTSGSASVLQAHAEAFDQILNPFGAQDSAQTVLNDIAEGDVYYDAVRFAFEHGLMEAVSEDSFGVAKDAVVGDWALGVFQMLGGIGTQVDATEALSRIGLLPPEITADAPMTRTDLTGACNVLCQMVEIEPIDTTLPDSESDNATRGDVALLLMRLDAVE